jgi:hypothetical protein
LITLAGLYSMAGSIADIAGMATVKPGASY